MASSLNHHSTDSPEIVITPSHQQHQQQPCHPQAPSRLKMLAASLSHSKQHSNNNNTIPLFVPNVIAEPSRPSRQSFPWLTRMSGWRLSMRSPRAVIAGGCLELFALLIFFSRLNILEGEYFRFGPPVYLFQYEVAEKTDFYIILCVFFFHQVTYTWITETLNPWLLNEVQDQKCETIRYSKPVTLSVINLYTAYLTLNNILVLNIAFSQVSFLVVVLLADVVSTTLLNLSYIWHKTTVCNNCDPLPDQSDSDTYAACKKSALLANDEEAQLLLKGYNVIPSPGNIGLVTKP